MLINPVTHINTHYHTCIFDWRSRTRLMIIKCLQILSWEPIDCSLEIDNRLFNNIYEWCGFAG
jgi:hypothetical protein